MDIFQRIEAAFDRFTTRTMAAPERLYLGHYDHRELKDEMGPRLVEIFMSDSTKRNTYRGCEIYEVTEDRHIEVG